MSLTQPVASPEAAIDIHDVGAPALSIFDRSWMLGTWRVSWSTLPMWKSRRNVTITYTARRDTGPETTTLNSDVAYSPLSPSAVSALLGDRSHVRGTERLTAPPTGWTWRGDGWLAVATSEWWVRGWGARDGVEWMFIYFGKTMFTPAGMDVLLRPGEEVPETEVAARLERVRDAVVGVVRERLGAEAEAGFQVALG